MYSVYPVGAMNYSYLICFRHTRKPAAFSEDFVESYCVRSL